MRVNDSQAYRKMDGRLQPDHSWLRVVQLRVHLSRSGLNRPVLSRQSVGTHQGNDLTRNS